MTLTDKEYQRMRDAACRVIREIGVETGGSNVQFAINPADGRMVVVEMNPRVSRSSALASKATGFPIAKIAAKLAVGYTLDEIKNDITRETPASFEPTIDYVVVKVPRFAFEKFPGADATLTTQMKSVGEVMAIGRTFREALGKAIRSLETGRTGFDLRAACRRGRAQAAHGGAHGGAAVPAGRGAAPGGRRRRDPPDHRDRSLVPRAHCAHLAARRVAARPACWRRSVRRSCARSSATGSPTAASPRSPAPRPTRCARAASRSASRRSTSASTPAAPSSSRTRPISTRPTRTSARRAPTDKKKIVILGGGPNRIGQGIEFDYCCVHAVQALREEGFETIMVNCNPETVSTDYDTADRLYFEPLTREDVLNLCEVEKPDGVIVQFGGQTPLRLAVGLGQAGVKLLGTSADAIDRAEDRAALRRGDREAGAARRRRTAPPPTSKRRSPSPIASGCRWWCAPRTSSAAARWRSCTTASTWPAT